MVSEVLSAENKKERQDAMAFQVSPPEAFDFSNPENWPKWIRRFDRFRQASGLSSKDEGQVNESSALWMTF